MGCSDAVLASCSVEAHQIAALYGTDPERIEIVAPGVEPFARVPTWVLALPPERQSHTGQLSDLERFAGSRVLIVGGRQGAFETAALLAESGADRVDIVHRHDPPRFTHADWGFVEPLIEATVRHPGWFRELPIGQRAAIERHFWAEAGSSSSRGWLRASPDTRSDAGRMQRSRAAARVATPRSR